ncbi:MAG: hypothetical protein IH598_07560 [Bacteroidales bacterium]|nr:hypothetical protein [Bacteroidales bacterium]
MKRIVLVLSLAFFLGTAFVTVSKIQQVNAATTELAFITDDATAFASINDDEPKKEEKAKDAKASKCASSASCDKTSCASKSATGEKAACCDKSKASADAGKAACCSKEKAVDKDSDKK